ncbi:MAG: prepilin-type N-terminal cleavage/methylation domain-containing protein, partial [Limisphaerales bacterium]
MIASKRRELEFPIKAPAGRDHMGRAFTVVELLVVMALVAVLAVFVLPAIAGVQNKGGRLDCANNLRQIGMDSMIFAGENNGWLPVCTLGAQNAGGKTNYLGGPYYTQYLFTGPSVDSFVPTNAPSSAGTFQNEGYLYEAGLVGNGNIFYCPAEWGRADGANSYLPLLTSDLSGNVRSSYFYNPRMAHPTLQGGNNQRRYQTTSQLEPHRLFAVDSIIPNQGNGIEPGAGVNPASIEHARDHGWNVLFTDGSVQFARLTQADNYDYNLITQELIGGETGASWLQY